MKPSELEAALREKGAEWAEADIKDMTDNGGFGLVRYTRETGYETEHVVHRWAVVDTSGKRIPLLLWSGLYTTDEDEARREYLRRDDPGRLLTAMGS